MVKSGMNYNYIDSLEKKHKSKVTLQSNFITANLPNIYTIFNPDSETWLVELSDPEEVQATQADITLRIGFELTLDQIAYARSDYNLLQFIGDVGSLYGALYGMFQFLLNNIVRISVLLDFEIIQTTFKSRLKNFELVNINLSYWNWFWAQVLCCFCCNRLRTNKLQRVGLRRVERELDIAHFLR